MLKGHSKTKHRNTDDPASSRCRRWGALGQLAKISPHQHGSGPKPALHPRTKEAPDAGVGYGRSYLARPTTFVESYELVCIVAASTI